MRQALRRVGDLIRCARERGRAGGDAMRAKLPDQDGFVERDGVQTPLRGLRRRGRRPCCSCRRGASSIRGSTRRSCPTSASASAASPTTGAATASPTGRTTSTAYSLDNYVADALAVMDATDAGQAILVGLSFGGMLACVLAAHHPERVKAAILAGTAALHRARAIPT